jgi:lipopolysaccharide export system protein LptA
MKPGIGMLILGCLLASPLPAFAEKADREKPVNLEADRITVDDAKKLHIFEGHVQLVQGTLIIRSDKLVVTQDEEGFQSGVATGGEGGLARFRQKRDGKDEYVDGEAERIEYDGKADRAQFFLRAHIKSGQDEVRGQYISYDGKSETYLVTSGPRGTIAPPVPGKDSRVHAVIQPKESAAPNKPAGEKAAPEAPPLKTAPEINSPRQE